MCMLHAYKIGTFRNMPALALGRASDVQRKGYVKIPVL